MLRKLINELVTDTIPTKFKPLRKEESYTHNIRWIINMHYVLPNEHSAIVMHTKSFIEFCFKIKNKKKNLILFHAHEHSDQNFTEFGTQHTKLTV